MFKAFYGCKNIERVIFSKELKFLSEDILESGSANPFIGCESITEFVIAEDNEKFKTVDGIIYEKSGKKLVAYPTARIGVFAVPETVKEIADYAFSNARVSGVIFGENITKLGIKAFSKSYIKTLRFPKLPDGVTLDIGKNCFSGCKKLERVDFAENAVSSGGAAFRNCTNLSEVYMPDTMTELSRNMFRNCRSLEKVTLPAMVTKLPINVFKNCESLQEINLENITQIGRSAFENCISLNGVLTLNAESILRDSFKNCTGITEVIFNNPVKQVGFFRNNYGDPFNAFAGCTSIESYTAKSAGNYNSKDGALYTDNMKTLVAYPPKRTGKVMVPEGVKCVAAYAFSGSSASEIVIPEGL